MAETEMSEDKAYSLMRNSAMVQGKRLSEIALEIITVQLGLDYVGMEACLVGS